MRKIIALILISALACMMLAGCSNEINDGSRDALYNDVVYERSQFPNYNLAITEDNAKYIGDFIETYDSGYQLPWEVYVLNSEENVLYSAHAVWIKPGYAFPSEFGEDFLSADYVVTEGIDFLVMEDEYKEIVTHLTTFDGSVKLENIIETEASDVSGYTEHDYIRLTYKNHANMSLYLTLCSLDGQYYLNVRQGADGEDALFKINPEYVDLFTSVITNAK